MVCNIVFDSFSATVAELSSCDRDHLAYKPKIFALWLFKKKLANACYKIKFKNNKN